MVKKTYKLPKELCDRLEASAVKNKQTNNKELIDILENYFSSEDKSEKIIKLEPWIEKSITEVAEKKGSSLSWEVNFLLALKLSDFDIEEKNYKAEGIKPNIKNSDKTIVENVS